MVQPFEIWIGFQKPFEHRTGFQMVETEIAIKNELPFENKTSIQMASENGFRFQMVGPFEN
jgi:hypothetical protein